MSQLVCRLMHFVCACGTTYLASSSCAHLCLLFFLFFSSRYDPYTTLRVEPTVEYPLGKEVDFFCENRHLWLPGRVTEYFDLSRNKAGEEVPLDAEKKVARVTVQYLLGHGLEGEPICYEDSVFLPSDRLAPAYTNSSSPLDRYLPPDQLYVPEPTKPKTRTATRGQGHEGVSVWMYIAPLRCIALLTTSLHVLLSCFESTL